MATKLTKKQKLFANEYIDTGNGLQSALVAYDTKDPNTAAMIASENLTKPNVKEYIESHAEEAASMIYQLSQKSEQDNIRLSASKDILDRAGYGAVNKSETKSLNLTVEARLEDKDDLNAIRERFDNELKKRLLDENK